MKTKRARSLIGSIFGTINPLRSKIFNKASRKFFCPAFVLSLSGAIVTYSCDARAAESVIPVTPPGSTDIDQAVLPPFPGFYGGVAVLPFDQNTNLYDTSGNKVSADRTLHIRLELIAPALVYVYPFRPFGGTIASVFVQPIEQLNYSIGLHYQNTANGLADAYSDIFYWTKDVGLFGATPGAVPVPYGLSVGLGFAMVIPDGNYHRTTPLNNGGHAWVLDPNAAMTYNSGPRLSFGDNTQVSARLFYGIAQKNPATDYTSGQVMDIDWSTTQQFGNLRLGVAGYYQTQTTADTSNGPPLVDGNRFTEAAAGPVAEYFFPKSGAFIKAKYQYTFYHRNFPDQQFLVLSYGTKF